jgi:type IV secretion system protein VirB10
MSDTYLFPAKDAGTLVVPVDPRTHASSDALILASQNAYPIVATSTRRSNGTGLLAGATIAALLGGLTFYSMASHRTHAPALPSPAVEPNPDPMPTVQPVPQGPPAGADRPPVVDANPVAARQAPLPVVPAGVDGAHSVTLVFDGSTPVEPDAAGSSGAKPAARPDAGTNENDQFAVRIAGEGDDAATAEQMTDPGMTVGQGTIVPAVLETAIDTDLPGYVRASVSSDIRSFDGSRVLIPRFSRVIGQYKSGLQAGQTRVYIVWQRLIRPDGVTIALASPAIDFSGRTGLGGEVDSHFLKRFGSAALLSVVGGLSAIGNPSVVLSGGQSAASVAAQRDTQIPPTIRVPQGQPIRIFTARDLDFGSSKAAGEG